MDKTAADTRNAELTGRLAVLEESEAQIPLSEGSNEAENNANFSAALTNATIPSLICALVDCQCSAGRSYKINVRKCAYGEAAQDSQVLYPILCLGVPHAGLYIHCSGTVGKFPTNMS